jgi:uncharacterized protein YutE (UPF0331/DUF86 family)
VDHHPGADRPGVAAGLRFADPYQLPRDRDANRWELPSSARQAATILGEHGVRDPSLQRGMLGVVGFRNIAVHQYADLDPVVVEAIADRGLDVLEGFAGAVLEAVATAPHG